jgi:polysaccharide export outer membrane protein
MLKKILIGLLLISSLSEVFAQVLLNKTKASDYSDTEISQMIIKAETAGLTESQVIDLARAQGMTESEMEAFKSRVLKIKGLAKSNDAAVSSEAKVKSISPKQIETNNPGLITELPNSTKNEFSKAPIKMPQTPNLVSDNNQIGPVNIVATSWDVSKIFDEKRFQAFANGRTIKAPDQYIVGVGDEVSVTVFGNSYFNKVSRVDDRGRIDLGTALGKVYVKGISFGKLEKLLSAAIAQKISLVGNELEVDLSFSRQISVNVTGEIQKPGTYQLPAANTVFNLLVLSGGPTENGSIREVEVVRSGIIVFKFDLYQFLVNPQHNSFLEDGDFIVVKPVKKRINLRGGVLRSGQVELLENEGLHDALTYAGGLTAKADLSRITLSRLNGRDRTLIQLNVNSISNAIGTDNMILNSSTSIENLKDGDQIFVFEQTESLQNQVKITGEVYFPGDYALKKAMTVEDLLQLAGGLTPESNKKMAFIIRTRMDGTSEYLKLPLNAIELKSFELENNDQLVIFGESRFVDAFQVEIRGEVRNPLKIDFRKGLTLNVLLDYSGGLKYSADATEVEILRSAVHTANFKPGDQNITESIKVVYNPSLEGVFDDIELMAEDIVVVRRVSNLDDKIGASIEGEVLHPGLFIMAKNVNSVRDIIEKSGGLTEYAFPDAAQLYRKNGQQVVFELNSVLRNKNSEFNYRLEDGDRLVIPLKQDLVIIPNTDTLLNKEKIFAPFISGKRAAYFLKNYSLGFDDEHRIKWLYLLEPGGKIKRSKNYGLFVITPKVKAGSEIFFQPSPKKTPTEERRKQPVDWNRVIENFTLKLTGIATLWVLMSKI